MPLTAHDLRYRAEEIYPALYAHLSRQAQRFLGMLKFDAFELDLVVGHVMEQLVRMGLLGGGDKTPPTALDKLTNAQLYAFLNRSIRNKAIDRLRKRRLQISSAAELESPDAAEGEDDPLNDATETIWGPTPFATPEEVALELASQQELRNLLIHCLKELGTAPRQLQAVIQELEAFDATELLHTVIEEMKVTITNLSDETPIAHISQHRDHAHKKIRHCLQQQSTNLTVMIALRLTEYATHSGVDSSDECTVSMQSLMQDDLSIEDVRTGLNQLTAEGVLNWHESLIVHITPAQVKRLLRFYKEE
jgi:DNA-directed RNA polymerase specialized sigma24 family protein